jgi:hypothetical protein
MESALETITEQCLSPINKARFMSLAATHPTIETQRFNIYYANMGYVQLPISSGLIPEKKQFGYVCI